MMWTMDGDSASKVSLVTARTAPTSRSNSYRSAAGLNPQVELHERDCRPDDLARPLVVVAVVEAVRALRVVHQRERHVLRERRADETVYRVVHRRHFVLPRAR